MSLDQVWTYPYAEEVRGSSCDFIEELLLRPVVPIRVGTDPIVYTALVDSGSDHTLAPRWLADAAGVVPDPNREIVIGIGGMNRQVQFQEVELELCDPSAIAGGECDGAGPKWTATMGFFMHWTDPRWLVILGQRGFFNHYTVSMSRHSMQVAIEHRDEFDNRYGLTT